MVAGIGLTPRAMADPARVERDGTVSAARTRIQMSAERSRAAALDGSQHFQVQPVQPRAIAVNKTPAGGADKTGHLERWPSHQSLLAGLLVFVLSVNVSAHPGD